MQNIRRGFLLLRSAQPFQGSASAELCKAARSLDRALDAPHNSLMTIICAAVVGQSNNPLYLEAFQGQSDDDTLLKFHRVAHCSLDAVEEKLSVPRKVPGETGDPYLGMLYPTQDYKVYGYVSNTKVKFLLILEEPLPKDEELRLIFRRFHAAYVDAVSNPFYTLNTPIHSRGFDASVRTIVTTV